MTVTEWKERLKAFTKSVYDTRDTELMTDFSQMVIDANMSIRQELLSRGLTADNFNLFNAFISSNRKPEVITTDDTDDKLIERRINEFLENAARLMNR